MAEQLSFELPLRPAFGRADFMISPGNSVAVSMLERWPDWPNARHALVVPKGAGKTHLAHVWAALSGAQVVPARALEEAEVPRLVQAPLVVEDVPDIRGDHARQTTLFHLVNLSAAEANPLLLTGVEQPGRWTLDLPDLASRMAALPVAVLGPPDDALLQAVLAKLFADRQLRPHADVIPYLASHMDRSFEAAGQIVAALDTAALRQRRQITRPLAREVLAARIPAPE